jgi:hypothetical protein
MRCHGLALSVLALLSVACATPSPTATDVGSTAGKAEAPAGAAAPKSDAEAAEAKAAAKKQKQKELRNKQRELEAARGEQQVAGYDRRVRQLALDASLQKTATDLEHAKKELAVFLAEVKPRELEERRMSLDSSSHRAEHSKDELGELVAMYEADEFARTTKELVLKRGRRELEMADRSLAVAKKELAHFENHTLPQRERELQQKVADAELERKKVELEAEKWKLEQALADRKAQDRLSDLEEEIRELETALAKESA